MYSAAVDTTALSLAGMIERLEKVCWYVGFWQGAVSASLVILVAAWLCSLLRKRGR